MPVLGPVPFTGPALRTGPGSYGGTGDAASSRTSLAELRSALRGTIQFKVKFTINIPNGWWYTHSEPAPADRGQGRDPPIPGDP